MVTRFEAPGGAATDLALAMGLGAGLFDPAGIPRLLVVSDGAGDQRRRASRPPSARRRAACASTSTRWRARAPRATSPSTA